MGKKYTLTDISVGKKFLSNNDKVLSETQKRKALHIMEQKNGVCGDIFSDIPKKLYLQSSDAVFENYIYDVVIETIGESKFIINPSGCLTINTIQSEELERR